MNKHTDPDRIFKIEKAVSKKYGDDTVRNPKSTWSAEKEKRYLSSLKSIFQAQKKEKVIVKEVNGIKVLSRLINTERKPCTVCEKYSLNKMDDIYLDRFQICEECFYKHVDGREERWQSGWRPMEKTKDG